MEPETPPESSSDPSVADAAAPVPAPPVTATAPAHRETAHERHTREFEQSLEVLEDTVEHGFVKFLKIAIPLLAAFVLAAIGLYVLGGKMRDRSEARRVAGAMRRASRAQTSS